ncbi:MAG: aminopeptidase [Desulfovibrio sp.]|nr:aminopeptidase [Desulfovibrio sp.]
MMLSHTSRNCWEIYSGQKDEKAMSALAKGYIEFLSLCKTERETVDYAEKRLRAAGFSPDCKTDRVMRVLHGKSMCVVRRGNAPLKQGLRLICAHADTPRLDLKQHPLQEQAGVGQAKTHYYGGIRKYQWFARALALHGVVVKQDGTVISVVLGENMRDPVFTIADLLPHLAQGQAEQSVAKAFDPEKLNIILGHKPLFDVDKKKNRTAKAFELGKPVAGKAPEQDAERGDTREKTPIKTHILSLLQQQYDIIEEDLYSAELQAVPAGAARFVGLDAALIGGYGQDDRICVFAALEAFLSDVENRPSHTQYLIFWDKEEIGSEGSTGAKSRFFEYCLQEIIAAWESDTRFSDVVLASKALSADVHAAVDPDWQELHEKLNAATIGHGPCFCKFTGHRGKYEANDAHPEYIAWLRSVLNSKGIPWQMAELGKVDGGGGGTVAMHLAAYGMNVIDCGPPILSMHSPFEIASKADLYATMLAYKAFLQA